MDSKRRFSVRFRLLLPIIGSMFALVVILIFVQYSREEKLRLNDIGKQLNFISSRLIVAHERKTDIKPFLNFIRRYYDNSEYDEVQVSIYDSQGRLIDAIGREFRVPQDYADQATNTDGVIGRNNSGEIHFYSRKISEDGQLEVHTAMPWNEAINNVLKTDNSLFFILLGGSFLLVIILAYLSTNFVVRNIKILQEFAHLANNSTLKVDESRLSHDELGDISKEIIHLYRGRVKAMENSDKEHAIAMHAIEEKRRVQHQLTNNINHELKTPVGVIRGYLETVLSSDDMDAETQKYFLTRALSNVERLCLLLNDVSTMTRLEEGSAKIIISEINFHDFVYGIKEDFAQSGMLKDMEFEYDIPLRCSVFANINLLTSAITNLTRNAVIHSHGTAMGINLVAESEKFYTFAFWDNGQGVPTEHVPHLFERFYRVEAGRSRKSGGTGLGLPIVKSTIESLGGAISVYNRAEGGLEFQFTLKKSP